MSKICMGCMTQYDDKFDICPNCGYIEGTKAAEVLHMDPGSILLGRYVVGKVLGFGGFGVTYIGWDALLEQKVAIKEYLPSEFSTRVPGQTNITVFNGDKQQQFNDGLSKFVEEAQRLAKFQQTDGIVKIFDSFESNNTAYIVMEYLDGETLSKYLYREHTVSPDTAIAMMIPIITSLEAVHSQEIIHRDIAPDNIFLTNDGKIKLIDFGASRFATTSHSRSLTVIIKPGYSPEEQYRSRGDQGPHTDVYAIGATLYKMITGVTPPDALERRAFFESKQKDILKPITKSCRNITVNHETAILNALNIRIEDRTPDMAALASELASQTPVARRQGKIKKIDILRWPLWAKILVPSAAALIITLSTLFAFGIIGFNSFLQKNIVIPDGMSRVPSIINNDIDKAETQLTNVTLLYSIVGKDYSDLVPANLVLTQSINAGSVVTNNTVVEISISGGVETKTVPDVSGLSIDDAQKQLEDLGFAVQTKYDYSSVVAENMIISQDKATDSDLAVGETVTLTVSKGVDPDAAIEQKMSKVPNFVGVSYQDALKTAEQEGFILSVKSKQNSSQYDKDVIMSQSIPADSDLMTGNTIEIVVSLGIQTIKIPDVQYKTETDARAMLAGLAVNVTYQQSDTVASGVVISQSPAAGTSAASGDEVNLVVSKGGESFAMVSVVGMSEADAKSSLAAKGLSVSVEYANNDKAPVGSVIAQNIAANTSVNKGAKVVLTVSSGQNLVTVANVVGKTENNATNTLKSQGLAVSSSQAYSDNVDKGLVISQSPTAGSSQQPNSTVVLTVSNGKTPISIPHVAGKTQAVAMSSLQNVGFTATTTSDYSDTIPSGSVISQNPSAGVNGFKGDVIALVISKGNQPISVPNVVGQTKADATNAIQSLGLTLKTLDDYSDTVAEGNIISQNPTAGSTAAKDNLITLTVSKGKAPNPSTGVSLSQTSITLVEKGTSQLVATVTPDNADDKSVTWQSNDQSVATVSANGLVTAIKNGTATITVTTKTGNISRSCTVTVQPRTVVSVGVLSGPNITQYNVGDTLDTTGLRLYVTYNDNSSDYLTSGFTCSPTTLSNAGTQAITVTLNDCGQTTMFNVTVLKVLSGISVTSPTKTVYNVGESFDTKGMKVIAAYSDGSAADVTNLSSVKGFDSSKGQTEQITVSYTEGGVTETGTFNVSIQAVLLTGITVTPPAKTTYNIGDSLDTRGMKVISSYSDGSTKDVTTLCPAPAGFDSSKAGTEAITISYMENGVKVTAPPFYVTIVVTLVKIDATFTRTTLYVGDNLNSSGMKITATYSDNSTKDVTASSTVSGFDSSRAGTVTLTISYTEGGVTVKTTSPPISIIDDPITSAVIKTPPTTTTYSSGDTLNSAGLTLTATHASGKPETITSGFVCNPTTLTNSNQVTYNVSIKTAPTKTTYTSGDSLDTTGLTLLVAPSQTAQTQSIAVTYNGISAGSFNVTVNGTANATTVSSGFTCSPTTLTNNGTSAIQQTITVTYQWATAQFQVTVNPNQPPIKISSFNYQKGWESTTPIAIISVTFTTNVPIKHLSLSMQTMSNSVVFTDDESNQGTTYMLSLARGYFVEATYTINISVTDANGNTDSEIYTLNLGGVPTISFNSNSITMSAGSSLDITAYLSNGVTDQTTVWISSDDNIVSVSGNYSYGSLTSIRTLTANSTGTVTITVSFAEQAWSGSAYVTYCYISQSFTVTVTP